MPTTHHWHPAVLLEGSYKFPVEVLFSHFNLLYVLGPLSLLLLNLRTHGLALGPLLNLRTHGLALGPLSLLLLNLRTHGLAFPPRKRRRAGHAMLAIHLHSSGGYVADGAVFQLPS